MTVTAKKKTLRLKRSRPILVTVNGAVQSIPPCVEDPSQEVVQVFENVFDALADTPDEAANLRARADLIRQITAAIRERGWTQQEAAEHCRLTQPRISDLMNGRISKFSLDALVNVASALGKVTVQLSELEPA